MTKNVIEFTKNKPAQGQIKWLQTLDEGILSSKFDSGATSNIA